MPGVVTVLKVRGDYSHRCRNSRRPSSVVLDVITDDAATRPLAPERRDRERGRTLLDLARRALETGVRHGRIDPRPDEDDLAPWLLEPGATFVTLRLRDDGTLRGCVGSVEARRPLIDDVRENAVAAARRDPRFVPVEPSELPGISIEVSRLTTPEPLPVTGRDDALRRLVPGRDGVILSWSGGRATFLPQVWEQLPDPADFLAHLEHKAGLPPGTWAISESFDVRLERYRAEKWSEPDRGI